MLRVVEKGRREGKASKWTQSSCDLITNDFKIINKESSAVRISSLPLLTPAHLLLPAPLPLHRLLLQHQLAFVGLKKALLLHL